MTRKEKWQLAAFILVMIFALIGESLINKILIP